MSSLRNNMRKWCIQWRLHKDLCIPFFLAPKTMKSSRTCKTSDNEHFFGLSNSCTSNLLLLHLSLWIPNLNSRGGSYILYFTTAQRINRLQQAGKKHDGNMEHISLQFIMDYVYLHKLLVKAQQAHSGQMLSS